MKPSISRVLALHAAYTPRILPHSKPAEEDTVLNNPKIKNLLRHLDRAGWAPYKVEKTKVVHGKEDILPKRISRPFTKTFFVIYLRNKDGREDTWKVIEYLQPFYLGDMPDTSEFIQEWDNHSWEFEWGEEIQKDFK